MAIRGLHAELQADRIGVPLQGEPGIAQEFAPHELPDGADPIGYFDRIVLVELNVRLYGAEVSCTRTQAERHRSPPEGPHPGDKEEPLLCEGCQPHWSL